MNRYAKHQESGDKTMDIGSVGCALSKCGEALGWICLLFSPAHPSEASVASWRVYAAGSLGAAAWASSSSAVKIQPNPHWKELIPGALLFHLSFTSYLPSPAFSSCPLSPPAPFSPHLEYLIIPHSSLTPKTTQWSSHICCNCVFP